MLRGVWQALNCLFIHATYCVIVAGASSGEIKMWAAVRENSDFLRRDAMQARSMLSCSVRLSVCPSVTFVYHVKTNKQIFEIFSLSGSDTILVFQFQKGCRYSDGNPPNGGVECKGYDKMTIFSQIYRCISETVIVRWAHAARQFVSIEFTFHPYNI